MTRTIPARDMQRLIESLIKARDANKSILPALQAAGIATPVKAILAIGESRGLIDFVLGALLSVSVQEVVVETTEAETV